MVNFRPASLSVLTDSQCGVAMTEKTGSMIKPYTANRVGEIEELSRDKQKLMALLHPIAAIPGKQNPADLGTRGRVTLEELEGSFLQQGPHFLAEPRAYWPI